MLRLGETLTVDCHVQASRTAKAFFSNSLKALKSNRNGLVQEA